MPSGLIFDIKRYSVHDGPGIRTTVFFKGCPLTCWWCHNPESRAAGPLLFYDAEKCMACHLCVDACPHGAVAAIDGGSVTDAEICRGDGACAAICPTEARQLLGRRYSVDELMAEIEKDRVFFEVSGGGVTFSGGEPLQQSEFLLAVLRACGDRGLHRAVDTTGAAPPDVLLEVARHADLFLYDLKTMDPDLHLEATGVALGPVVDNLERLLAAGATVQIRVPVVPGVSDGANIDATARFLRERPGIQGVSLLPYHQPAQAKHDKFGVPWQMPDNPELPPGAVEAMALRMESYGLDVTIGG